MSPTVHGGQDSLDDIRSSVCEQLSGRLQDFELRPHRGGLILAGRVRSYYAKQLVQHAVMEQTDSLILRNEISVTSDFP